MWPLQPVEQAAAAVAVTAGSCTQLAVTEPPMKTTTLCRMTTSDGAHCAQHQHVLKFLT
jgi:hypothetical protein